MKDPKCSYDTKKTIFTAVVDADRLWATEIVKDPQTDIKLINFARGFYVAMGEERAVGVAAREVYKERRPSFIQRVFG